MPPRYIAVPFLGGGPILPISTPSLTATPVSGTQINLAITYSGPPGAVSYVFEKSTNANGPYVPLASGTLPTFSDTGLLPSTTYFYRSRVQVTDGRFSDYSLVKSATTLAQVPAAPLNVVATDIDYQSVSVTWNAVSGATSYNIYRDDVLIGSDNASPFTDTGLAASTTYRYNVSAVNQFGEGSQSTPDAIVVTATAPVVAGKFKFNPGIAYFYIDQNQSRSTQLSRMQSLMSANPWIDGFEVFWNWADLENPALVGGSAQYDGSWASQTDVNAMKGFKLVDTFVNACASMNCQFMLHIYSYGGSSAAGAQSTNFPTSYAPAYLAGSPTSPYGPNTASSNGVNGGVWTNSYAGNSVGVAHYYRYWTQPVMDRIIAMGQAYGARYNSNPNFECVSLLDESTMSGQTGYSDSGAASTMIGPGKYFDAMRQAWPNTMVRWYGNYLLSMSAMDQFLAACNTYDIAVGGPDTCNESGTNPRSIDADFRYRGLTASVGNGGVRDFSVPNYVGVSGNIREVEPEDLNNPPSAAAGNRHLGSGNPVDIVTQANLMGATHMCWYDNRYAGPNINQTATAHPNLLDFIRSAQLGGNTNVNGYVAGVKLNSVAYPSSWPQ